MRIRTLFMSMVAGLAFVGCSNEEDMTSGNNGEPQYLTVSVNATSTLTRANSLQGEYEEGVGNENEVTNVRFYFFDADGNAARVKGENGGTYYDVAMSGTDKDMDNVEKILTATLVIQTPAKDKVPASIVAVVNPKSDLGAVASIAKLNEVIADHSSTTSFIMSSSVYANGTTKMEAVNVAGHLYPTADAAKADPVIIHVERVLAKARLTVGLTANNGVYKTSDDGSQKFGDEEIYVKFLGWNVTATAKTSRLMKEINPSWPSNLFGSTPLWNTADYYRSFWAVNPSEMSYNYGAFNTGDNAANAITAFDAGTTETPKKNYTYLQENASDDFENGTDPEKPSQVIIAAQLVKADGSTAIEFAEYAGERTTINGLIVKYAAASELWKDNEEGTGRVKIGVDDIELKTATEINAANQNTSGRYKVYAQLTADAAKKTWYTSEEADASPVDNANDILKALGGAKVWNDGYTYYYFDIQHLNGGASAENVKGKIGVVRNHIYAANINSLAGLGTPVYDPEEIIYPEHPEKDETFIAAQIRILSWRVVNQDIDLKW
ncbi:Mfa1 family fimbria major subunit [Phocaeicola plebeius]|uniref:Mfa1 family fimbria major subunit n=1 Tax=Phocaeicola plebeius TaxID=310297 RepID=UPI0026E92F60|nr:Mfa1 family fimbria major subunit [Phocaeicola plebeius]